MGRVPRMADETYVKLDPAKMGYKVCGTVPPEQQSMLFEAFESLKRNMGSRRWNYRLRSKKIFWINIWQEDEDDIEAKTRTVEISEPRIARALDKWCRQAVRKYCEPNAIMDGYGFIVNPKGTRYNQPWHIDSTTDAACIWIPLTPFTEKNATQYITLPSDTPEDVLERVAANVDEVNLPALARKIESLIVQQVVADPMSVLYMGRGTIHRGIRNVGEVDRIAFFISVHFIKDYEKNYPYRSESLRRYYSSVGAF
jgi:hypothetical protein